MGIAWQSASTKTPVVTPGAGRTGVLPGLGQAEDRDGARGRCMSLGSPTVSSCLPLPRTGGQLLSLLCSEAGEGEEEGRDLWPPGSPVLALAATIPAAGRPHPPSPATRKLGCKGFFNPVGMEWESKIRTQSFCPGQVEATMRQAKPQAVGSQVHSCLALLPVPHFTHHQQLAKVPQKEQKEQHQHGPCLRESPWWWHETETVSETSQSQREPEGQRRIKAFVSTRTQEVEPISQINKLQLQASVRVMQPDQQGWAGSTDCPG